MSSKPQPLTRDNFSRFYRVTTRWNDNDLYGHLNNVVYFELFDTAINNFLINDGLVDIHNGDTVGLVVENKCSYFNSVKYPDQLDIGIRVGKIGNTSVTYEIGVFKEGENLSSALGTFVHVYVNRSDHRPSPLSEEFKSKLNNL